MGKGGCEDIREQGKHMLKVIVANLISRQLSIFPIRPQNDASTRLALLQPHLQRTKLCDRKDAELDPDYVKKREKLKEVVASVIRPKIAQGKFLDGKEFVSFLEQILDALNQGEIPSTGSLLEVFNKGIVERCLKLYTEHMANMVLPMQGESCRKFMKSKEMLEWKFLRNSILVVAMQGDQSINGRGD